jgi:hypothetical protein
LKLDELFEQWLSFPHTLDLMTKLLEDVKNGRPVNTVPSSGSLYSALHAQLSPRNPPSPNSNRGSSKHSPPPRSPASMKHHTFSFGSTGSDPESPVLSPKRGELLYDHPPSDVILSPSPPLLAPIITTVNNSSLPKALNVAVNPPHLPSREELTASLGVSNPALASDSCASSPTKPPLSSHVNRQTGVHSTEIKPFYFPQPKSNALPSDSIENRRGEIKSIFQAGETADVLTDSELAVTVKNLCGFPAFFSGGVVTKINLMYDANGQRKSRNYGGDADDESKTSSEYKSNKGSSRKGAPPGGDSDGESKVVETKVNKVSVAQFLKFWEDEIAPYNKQERLFRIIAQPNRDYIVSQDFLPYLEALLAYHPGRASCPHYHLVFLQFDISDTKSPLILVLVSYHCSDTCILLCYYLMH